MEHGALAAKPILVPDRSLSGLTFFLFSLLGVCLLAYAAVVAYAHFAHPPHARQRITYEPKAGLTFPPDRPAPHVVVAEFGKVVARNAGRTAIPESELPYAREEIRAAIVTARNWARDFHAPNGSRAFASLYVELANFVPAAEKPTPNMIWDRQRKVIASLGNSYPTAGYAGARPIPAGDAQRALGEMLHDHETQFGYLFFIFFGILLWAVFVGFKFLVRLACAMLGRPNRPLSASGVKMSGVSVLLVGVLSDPINRLSNFGQATTAGTPLAGAAELLMVGIVVFLSLAAFSAVFDLLAYRTYVRTPAESDAKVFELAKEAGFYLPPLVETRVHPHAARRGGSARFARWIRLLEVAVPVALAVAFSVFGDVPYIHTLILYSALVAFGRLITIDDAAPGGWSNPDNSKAFCRSALFELLIRFLIFIGFLTLLFVFPNLDQFGA